MVTAYGRIIKARPDMAIIDFAMQGTEYWNKGSHLHQLRPIADPNGNRAERRAAKKKSKKK